VVDLLKTSADQGDALGLKLLAECYRTGLQYLDKSAPEVTKIVLLEVDESLYRSLMERANSVLKAQLQLSQFLASAKKGSFVNVSALPEQIPLQSLFHS
jgi:hypothetical protein